MNDILRTTAPDLTRIEISERRIGERNVDLLCRVTSDDTSETINLNWMQTNDVARQLYRVMAEKEENTRVLANVVKWQHALLDYNASYNAFLLEQITDDEFGEIAEKFAYIPQRVRPEELAPIVERIYRLTGIPYTPSDLAGLFKCEQEDAMAALSQVAGRHQELLSMLPSNKA